MSLATILLVAAPMLAQLPLAGPPVESISAASGSAASAQWRSHLDAGKAAHKVGDRVAAEREFQAALAAAGSDNPPGLATAVCLNALAVLRIESSRSDEAAPLLDQAVQIFETQQQVDGEFFASLLSTRAELSRLRQRPAQAERDYRRALAIKRLSKPVHDRALRGLVGLLCTQGRTEEATLLGAPLALICRDGSSGPSVQPGSK